MKKLFTMGMIVCIVILTACKQIDTENSAIIKPSEFSEETQKVLELFDDIMFYDYTADETIKSYTINMWVYEDGEWINEINSSGNTDKLDNQIAFRFTDTGYELFTIDENGHVKHTSPDIYNGFSDTRQQASTSLSESTEIVLNTEIPLWVKIGNNEDTISISKDFRDSICTAGVAVTVTFSDKAVE